MDLESDKARALFAPSNVTICAVALACTPQLETKRITLHIKGITCLFAEDLREVPRAHHLSVNSVLVVIGVVDVADRRAAFAELLVNLVENVIEKVGIGREVGKVLVPETTKKMLGQSITIKRENS